MGFSLTKFICLVTTAIVMLFIVSLALLTFIPLGDIGAYEQTRIGGYSQAPISSPMIFQEKYGDQECTLVARHKYWISGVVVATKRYSDLMAFSPMDVCIAWGPVAEPYNLRNISFWHDDRACFIRAFLNELYGVTARDVLMHVSNNHLILPSSDLRNGAYQIKVGDNVTIDGYLVDAHCVDSNGRHTNWRSSRIRNDIWCEIVYVQNLTVNGVGYSRGIEIEIL